MRIRVLSIVLAVVTGASLASIQALSQESPPLKINVAPSFGLQGSQFVALVSGNLLAATSVRFSGEGVSATIQSATRTQLTISVAISPNAPWGLRSITVTTPDGIVTLDSAFTVQPRPATTSPQPIPEIELGDIRSGYLIITPDTNSIAPIPTITFGIVRGGATQSQAGTVPGPMTTDASVFVEVIPAIGRNLGVAIANPANATNAITFTLRDENGSAIATAVTITLQPQQQLARFVNDLLVSNAIGTGFRGSLRMQSSTPFSVLGLRFSGIQFSTLPVAATAVTSGVPARTLTDGAPNTPLAGTVGGASSVILPQFAMSGGWATQLALVNNGSAMISGRVDVFDASGNAMPVKLNGNTQSTYRYSIPANGTLVLAPRDANGQSPF